MSEKMHDICDWLTDYLMGELSDDRVQQFALHVQSCLSCREELRILAPLHELLAAGEAEELSVKVDVLKAQVLGAAFAQRAPLGLEKQVDYNGQSDTTSEFVVDRSRTPKEKARSLRWGLGIWAVVSIIVFWLVPKADFAGQALLNKPLHMDASTLYPHTQGMLMMKIEPGMMALTLRLKGLPRAPTGGCFELWLVTPKGRHIGYGEFVPSLSGQATVVAKVPEDVSFVQVGITREPRWGDKRPLGQSVVQMSMPASM